MLSTKEEKEIDAQDIADILNLGVMDHFHKVELGICKIIKEAVDKISDTEMQNLKKLSVEENYELEMNNITFSIKYNPEREKVISIVYEIIDNEAFRYGRIKQDTKAFEILSEAFLKSRKGEEQSPFH